MDTPHRDIRFTTTDDGVSIAYWEIGEGKPVVILNPFSVTHAELEWTVPSIASFYTQLASRYRLIRFDCRGQGLSGEPPGGWGHLSETGAHLGMSCHEMGLDIDAVATALGIRRFSLMANGVMGPVGIEYAATHRESVSELILCEAMSNVASSYLSPLLGAQAAMNKIQTDMGQRLPFNPWERVVPHDELDIFLDLAHSGDRSDMATGGVGLTQAQMEWSAESVVHDIAVPTVVITSRFPGGTMLDDARVLAAEIADSQLHIVDGNYAPYFANHEAVINAIDGLLAPRTPTPEEPGESGFRTVVFTDVVESTEFIRRFGDVQGRAAVRDLEKKVAALAGDHGGRVVKNLGDGSLVSFRSNSAAIKFALKVQEECSDGPLQLRVGMAAGEPIQEEGDIHGTVVAHASRVADLGDAGDVIVSDTVRRLAAGKGFSFLPRGEVTLKGFDEPERIWRVTRLSPAS